MTAFLSGVMLLATMALTALALGIVVYARTRGERPRRSHRRDNVIQGPASWRGVGR